jgi:hemolysin type calcium-binding protein
MRQSHFIAVVGTYLIGCAVLLLAGCSGERSEAPQEDKQGHTEATKEQERSPEATASEEARCEGTRSFHRTMGFVDGSMYRGGSYLTNDLPGCPNGGLLSGTDSDDLLAGEDGDDEVRGLGARDKLFGGYGSDVIYGEPGRDFLVGGGGADVLYGGDGDDRLLHGGAGEDVLYGGDSNDELDGSDRARAPQRDKLYCGKGKDQYITDRPRGPQLDYVDSSCEKKIKIGVVF